MTHKRGCTTTYKFLYQCFNSLGRHVARRPSWFLVVPVFISFLLATGLQRLQSKLDVEYYTTVDNSESVRNRDLIEKLFPMDVSTNFDLGRYTRVGRFVVLMIKAKNNGSLLREDVTKDVIRLSAFVDNFTVEADSKTFQYKDLCLRNKGKCYKNDILPLFLNYQGNFSFKYPIEFYNNYGFKFYGNWMGGVEVNEAGIATSVKTMRLIYFFDKADPLKNLYTLLWQEKFLKASRSLNFESINILIFISKAIEHEMKSTIGRSVPYMIVAAILVMAFTISTCAVPNMIKGKPWTGLATAIASGLASLSGFGLVSYFGVPYLYYNILIPFLVLGVSMDDTFVFLSAWRRTYSQKSLEERMGQAYADSSIAISLTSVTNVVSFAIGAMMSPFPCVRVFCMLTSLCLLFDYIYQITFVGACMAFLGQAEINCRHCFTMIPVKPLKGTEGPQGCIQQILSRTGHYSVELKETCFLLTIWDKFANVLTKTLAKAIVLVIFATYLMIGLWSSCSLSSKIETKDMAFYNSPTYQFFKESSESFNQYLERIQVIVPNVLDYSDPKVSQTLHKMFKDFESTDFLCNSTMTESWLTSYHQFLTDPNYRAITSSYNVTDKRDFIKALREIFLRHPFAKRFTRDIKFNHNYTEILASRFLFQTNYTKDDSTFNEMWWNFQKLAKNTPIPVVVFHRFSYFAEGFKLTIPVTIQTLCVSTCAVAAISYLFLWSMKCTICVTLCILSIAIGVLGYMNIWGINMNVVSMTVIMLVSGFSVDYSSHVVCAYVSASGTSSEKLKKSLGDVGLPIFQASLTTILAVSVFVVPPSYSFLVLMKIVFLLAVMASLHALVFLPVFLSLLEDLFKHLEETLQRKHTAKETATENGHINHGADLSSIDDISLKHQHSETSVEGVI